MESILAESLFAQRMGVEWMSRLPATLADYERNWNLRIGAPFPNLTFHYVAPAVREDGSHAVLKIGSPSGEVRNQIVALRAYDGDGMVKLFEADEENGALLMEKIEPGVPLATLTENGQDELATSIAIEIMRKLHLPPPPDHQFPTVEMWASGLKRLRKRHDGGTGPFPPRLVEAAERLFPELFASATERVLFHGDIHHFNILSSERQPWLAIDPMSVVGDPGYEIGTFLRNPTLHTPQETLAHRLAQLSEELGIDRERAHSWALADGVLSAWWTFEYGEDPANDIAYCEQIAAIKL